MAALETRLDRSPTHDDAVFVARDGRRARRLRNAAIVAGVLAALWVVGLGVGMLGFGSLPGVALVKGLREHSQPGESVAPVKAQRHVARRDAAEVRSVRRQVARKATARRAVGVVARHSPAVTKKVARQAAATPPAAQAQIPVNPAVRTRGWARKGYGAPWGQVRKAAPPPPPATSRGRRVGPQKPLPAPPPAVSPGQAKKAVLEPPPPPPPPPPKKA